MIVEGGSDARYLPTGHIVYALNDGLFAVVFDLDTLTPSGGAVPLVQGVMRAANGLTGTAHYDVSEDGTLVYVAGSIVNFISTLLWTDREGREEALMLEPQDYNQVSVSPDGSRLAFSIQDGSGSTDVWTYNLASGIPTRLTFEPGIDDYPLWTPDSQRIVYFSERDDGGLFWQEADGTGQVERLTTLAAPGTHVPRAAKNP